MPKKKTYKKGHWMGIGIGFGMIFGTALFFIADLLTGEFGSMFFLGPGVGVAIGVSIGAALEEKYKDQIRPLTREEERTQRKAVLVGLGALALGLVALLAFLLFL